MSSSQGIKVFCRVRPSKKVCSLSLCVYACAVQWGRATRPCSGFSIAMRWPLSTLPPPVAPAPLQPCPYLSLNMEHNQVEYEIPVDLAPGIVNNTKTT